MRSYSLYGNLERTHNQVGEEILLCSPFYGLDKARAQLGLISYTGVTETQRTLKHPNYIVLANVNAALDADRKPLPTTTTTATTTTYLYGNKRSGKTSTHCRRVSNTINHRWTWRLVSFDIA